MDEENINENTTKEELINDNTIDKNTVKENPIKENTINGNIVNENIINKKTRNKHKNTNSNLGIIICLIIIIALVIALYMMWSYYNSESFKNSKNRTPITSEEFKSIIETKGFNVYGKDNDAVKEGVGDDLYVGCKSMFICEKNDGSDNFRVNFFETIDENVGFWAYYQEIVAIESSNNGQFFETNDVEGNYYKYTALSNGYYYVMVKIDKTILFGQIDADKKDVLDELLKELNY